METPQEKPRRGWLRRHWKLLLAIWLGVSLSGGLAAFLMLTNSDAANLAMAAAQSNPIVTERLGSPIKKGWVTSASMEVTAGKGHAELAIPVSGPKGHGTIYVEAHKLAGLWHLEVLQFENITNGERLDLLPATPPNADTEKAIAALDTEYQAAVEKNDAATTDRLLADDFILVEGKGETSTKADLLTEARSGCIHYERQDDTDQKVRVWGDTAVITAKLTGKGTEKGNPFNYTLWFSDT
jgi:ketosteroid isomerase-like protein